MALGTNHIIASEVTTFIPEVWSDDVLATYKANLVARDLVNVMNFQGSKGDTIHIPIPVRGAASAKAVETQVVLLQAGGDTEKTITIDQHWHYARLIEDIVKVQAMDSLRKFYTDDAGYALAKKVDSYILAFGGDFNKTSTAYDGAFIGSDGATAWDPTATANAGNATSLADEGIRRSIQRLDDLDVPGMNRVLVIPPVEKRKLLGLSRFTEQAFTGESGGGNSIRNGLVGDVYGIPVYVTSQMPTVADAGAATDQRAVFLFHKDAIVFAEQLAPRSQSQYKLEWLGDLFVSDTLFGGLTVRSTAGVALVVPST